MGVANPTAKALARDMFLAGSRPIDICKHLGVKGNTLSVWRHNGKWVEARERMRSNPCAPKVDLGLRRVTEQGIVIPTPARSEASESFRKELADELALTLKALRLIRMGSSFKTLNERCTVLASLVGSGRVVHGWDNESTPGLAGLSELRMLREALVPRSPAGEVVDVQEVACGPGTPTGSVPNPGEQPTTPQVEQALATQ